MVRGGSVISKNKIAMTGRALSMLLPVLLLLFIASPTFSAMNTPTDSERTVQGEVVGVHNMTDLTVLTIQTAKGIDNDVNVLAAPSKKADLCGSQEDAMNIKAGDKAAIEYHMLSGLAIADTISKKC